MDCTADGKTACRRGCTCRRITVAGASRGGVTVPHGQLQGDGGRDVRRPLPLAGIAVLALERPGPVRVPGARYLLQHGGMDGHRHACVDWLARARRSTRRMYRHQRTSFGSLFSTIAAARLNRLRRRGQAPVPRAGFFTTIFERSFADLQRMRSCTCPTSPTRRSSKFRRR